MEDQSIKWGLGVALVILSFFILYFVFIIIEPQIKFDPEGRAFCSAETFEQSCYNIGVETCEMIWNKFEGPCKVEVKANLPATRATSLIGPAVYKCVRKKFDKVVRSSRKTDGGEHCQTYFKKLDALSIE